MSIERVLKPWFVFRPQQLLRRVALQFRPLPPGFRTLQTSWGCTLLADPTKAIGRSIAATGVYELTVSEILLRLIKPGATVIDAGANIGYITLLAACASGPEGRVLAFEPNPLLFPILKQNVERFAAQHIANVQLSELALGEAAGTAELHFGSAFDQNDGIASLLPIPELAGTGGGYARASAVTISVATVDAVVRSGAVDVMKVDVEGYELNVFRGASEALNSHRIKHIVFEQHEGGAERATTYLAALGYEIFALGASFWGPELSPYSAGQPNRSQRYEAPNFVATVAREELLAAVSARGWRALRRIPLPPRDSWLARPVK